MFSQKLILMTGLVLAVLSIRTTSFAAGDEEKNTAAVRRWYNEVMNKGDMKAFEELVDPKYVEHDVTPGYPANKAGLASFVKAFRSAFPDLQVTINDIVAKGDKVWCYATFRGTHKGEFMGMAATGKKIEVHAFDIVRCVNGKGVEHWGLFDNATMMMQLGATQMSDHAKH